MYLLHASEPDTVHCGVMGTFRRQVGHFYVLKTHTGRDRWPQNVTDGSTWVFATARDDHEAFGVYVKDVQVKYVQVLQNLKERGITLLRDYQPFFGFSQSGMYHLVSYIRLWDVLRICCGSQMSSSWRAALVNMARNTTHYCAQYDLDVIETKLLQTRVHRLMGSGDSVSSIDRGFNGHYCTWFNRQVACQNFTQNRLPHPPYC